MVALYRTGNQAEALAAYQDIRRALAEELGLDPSRSLQELEGAILRQDASLDLPGPHAGRRSSVRRRSARRRRRRSASSRPTDACPFVGLATFGVHDADVFFGRERLVSEMVARLAEHALPRGRRPVRQRQVVGGAGRARARGRGGCPRRRRAGCARSSGRAPSRCGSSIASCSRPSTSRSGRGCPPGRIRSLAAASVLPEGTRLLVIVDQFEEVFTSVDDAAAAVGVHRVAGRRRPTSGTAAVVLALRADFYGRCAEEPALAERLAASQVLVGPMGREEYRLGDRGTGGAGRADGRARAGRAADRRGRGPAGWPAAALDGARRAVGAPRWPDDPAVGAWPRRAASAAPSGASPRTPTGSSPMPSRRPRGSSSSGSSVARGRRWPAGGSRWPSSTSPPTRTCSEPSRC